VNHTVAIPEDRRLMPNRPAFVATSKPPSLTADTGLRLERALLMNLPLGALGFEHESARKVPCCQIQLPTANQSTHHPSQRFEMHHSIDCVDVGSSVDHKEGGV